MFGETIKRRRIEAGLTLREFCRLVEEDPSNWSKIEREIAKPPQDKGKLKKVAEALGLELESEAFKDIQYEASVAAGRIPEEIASNELLINRLPAFLRTVNNRKPSEEELQKIMDFVERGL